MEAGSLLFDLVGVLLQRVVSSDRPCLKTGGALPYLHEMPGCPRSRMKIILTTKGVSGITGPVQSWSCGAAVWGGWLATIRVASRAARGG
jgi:hypothetical protein